MGRTTTLLALGALIALGGCGGDANGDNGSTSTGGSAPGSGGAATGGASTGGASTGGAMSAGGSPSTGGLGGGMPSNDDEDEPFELSSPSWDAVDNDDCTKDQTETCPLYPRENTFFGANVSPEMSWTEGPEGTQSYAIVLVDLSNTPETVHWAIWDIPATTTSLPAEFPPGAIAEPAGAQQAGFGTPPGYFGSGACGNVYEHRLFGLSAPSLEIATTDLTQIRSAIVDSGVILAESFVRLQSRDCP